MIKHSQLVPEVSKNYVMSWPCKKALGLILPLIFCWPSFTVYHRIVSPWHAVDQVLQPFCSDESPYHALTIASVNVTFVVGLSSVTSSFFWCHKFYGIEIGGLSKPAQHLHAVGVKPLFTLLAVWHGALSCWKIHSSFYRSLADFNSLSITLMYFSLFILLSHMWILPAPRAEKHPQIITVRGCFNVGNTLWFVGFSNRSPDILTYSSNILKVKVRPITEYNLAPLL